MLKTKFKNFHINFFEQRFLSNIALICTKFLGYIPHHPPEGSVSQNVDLGPGYSFILSLHQIRRYPAPYISKAGQKATPSNILQPFIPHCFPLQSPYINSRPFISSPHYFYSSPIWFRICPTPAQPTSILTRIVFPADQQPILNDQFYVEEMPEEIVIVVKLIYSDRTHST